MKTGQLIRLIAIIVLLAADLKTYGTTLYVNINSTNTVTPYADWSTAAADIQQAVDAATDGDTIMITNGTYLLNNEITITNAITVESVNGPELTIVDGGGSNRCFNLSSSSCTLAGITLQNGFPSEYLGNGGGVYCSTTDPYITNCTFNANEARFGGGLYRGTTDNCRLLNNKALRGGAMYEGMANYCTFEANEASEGGGGMYGNFKGGSIASHCTFKNNVATWSTLDLGETAVYGGGGMAGGTAINCIFNGNSANFIGGGASGTKAINSIFTGNSADDSGGGIAGHFSGYGIDSFATALNCTFTENSSGKYGGGLYRTSITNCVVWNNSAIFDDNINSNAYSRTTFPIAHSCSPDLEHGANGNITNAPAFVDAAAGNYRLQSNSPCINWGSDVYVSTGTDLDGNPRIVGTQVDMGAYEYQIDLGDDVDGDGVSDTWEQTWFGYNVLPTDNADGDIFSNGDEYIAGTDPTSSTSLFAVTNALPTAEGFVVKWDAVEGRAYSVQWSDALTNHYQTMSTNMLYPQNSYTDTVHTAEDVNFYRLEVELTE